MGFTSVPRAKKRRRSEKAEGAENSAGRGRTEFARICIRRAILARAKLDVKPEKKDGKTRRSGALVNAKAQRKERSCPNPLHCLHSLLTKFLQLQRAPAPHLNSMTFQRFQSLRVSTAHNSLSVSDAIIKMTVFPPIVTLICTKLKITHHYINFSPCISLRIFFVSHVPPSFHNELDSASYSQEGFIIRRRSIIVVAVAFRIHGAKYRQIVT